MTGNELGHVPKLLFNNETPLPRKFNTSFLKNNHNKERLNLYCADKFQSTEEDVQSFNIIKGQSDSTLDESISINTAEEADQKLFWQMIQCVRSALKQFVVRTADMDVVKSLTACRRLVESFDCVVFALLSSAVSNRFHNINEIVEEHGERKCRALPFFYALAGWNIVSSFFSHGNCKFSDWRTESQEEKALTTAFMELSEKTNAVIEEKISVYSAISCHVTYTFQSESTLIVA